MGTHQQTWPVATLMEATDSSAEDRFPSAPSADMDFASLYSTINPNEQQDWNMFGFSGFGDDRDAWEADLVSASDGMLGPAPGESADGSFPQQLPAAHLSEEASSHNNQTQEGPITIPQQSCVLPQDQPSYHPFIQDLFPMEQSTHDGEDSWSIHKPHRSMVQPDCYIQQAQLQHHTRGPNEPWVKPEHSQSLNAGDIYDDEDSSDGSDPCYAQLLFRCLKEAPGHTMTLKDVYEWVARNSKKASDPGNRGWQNSVRHNLSMNKAFERVPQSANQGPKKGSLWCLTDKALREGVISTTRFRKDPKRKPERRTSPAPKRQASGAKGGQATRRAANARYAKMQRLRQPFVSADMGHTYHHRGGSPTIEIYPTSHVRLPSPHPTMFVHTAPTSPYFVEQRGQTPGFTSNPVTPPQLPLSCGADAKHFLPQYNLQHIDFSRGGLFGNRDDVLPDTPSLASETSMHTDDGHLMSQHCS